MHVRWLLLVSGVAQPKYCPLNAKVFQAYDSMKLHCWLHMHESTCTLDQLPVWFLNRVAALRHPYPPSTARSLRQVHAHVSAVMAQGCMFRAQVV